VQNIIKQNRLHSVEAMKACQKQNSITETKHQHLWTKYMTMIIPAECLQQYFKDHILLAHRTVWTRKTKKIRMIREIVIFNIQAASIMNTWHLLISFNAMFKEPSEFTFQDNINLLQIKHKLYILKGVHVSTQYAPPQIVYSTILTVQIVHLQ